MKWLVGLGALLALALAGCGQRASPRLSDVSDVPPTGIVTWPLDLRSNVPFASGTIATSTVYNQSDGHLWREVFAGGAGCSYGKPDSCTPAGNTDFERIGIIIDTVVNLDGLDPPGGPRVLLPGTGMITFTHATGDKVYFRTALGKHGLVLTHAQDGRCDTAAQASFLNTRASGCIVPTFGAGATSGPPIWRGRRLLPCATGSASRADRGLRRSGVAAR